MEPKLQNLQLNREKSISS
uniref:Uncharacterized protein n=1 Tax=Rhizophora mucronata TaxID=61149 RepID=A0A2P2R580_RHIMU